MNTSPNNRLVKGLDLVIDFATIGEYRIVTDNPRRPVAESDLWARDLDWTAPARSRTTECRLPRARDRALARERVRG